MPIYFSFLYQIVIELATLEGRGGSVSSWRSVSGSMQASIRSVSARRGRRDRVAFVAVTASNVRFPLFLTTTNCLDFLLLVAGPERSETVPNRTYLCRELIVSSLCCCIDTETYCSELRGIIHARADFHAVDYCNGFRIQSWPLTPCLSPLRS